MPRTYRLSDTPPISPRRKSALKKLAALPDESIDYSDIPALDNEWFKQAKLVLPEAKQAISLRLDKDVYRWLKSQGPRYQSRINAILRAYMQSQR